MEALIGKHGQRDSWGCFWAQLFLLGYRPTSLCVHISQDYSGGSRIFGKGGASLDKGGRQFGLGGASLDKGGASLDRGRQVRWHSRPSVDGN